MHEILGVHYEVFGPGDFYELLKIVRKEKLIPPMAKDVMKARVSITEKRRTFWEDFLYLKGFRNA